MLYAVCLLTLLHKGGHKTKQLLCTLKENKRLITASCLPLGETDTPAVVYEASSIGPSSSPSARLARISIRVQAKRVQSSV